MDKIIGGGFGRGGLGFSLFTPFQARLYHRLGIS